MSSHIKYRMTHWHGVSQKKEFFNSPDIQHLLRECLQARADGECWAMQLLRELQVLHPPQTNELVRPLIRHLCACMILEPAAARATWLHLSQQSVAMPAVLGPAACMQICASQAFAELHALLLRSSHCLCLQGSPAASSSHIDTNSGEVPAPQGQASLYQSSVVACIPCLQEAWPPRLVSAAHAIPTLARQ